VRETLQVQRGVTKTQIGVETQLDDSEAVLVEAFRSSRRLADSVRFEMEDDFSLMRSMCISYAMQVPNSSVPFRASAIRFIVSQSTTRGSDQSKSAIGYSPARSLTLPTRPFFVLPNGDCIPLDGDWHVAEIRGDWYVLGHHSVVPCGSQRAALSMVDELENQTDADRLASEAIENLELLPPSRDSERIDGP